MVSIILSTYNRAHTLRETIDSILNQTYRDFELIIIDDGSTDCTQEILAKYHDERMHLITFEENQFYCVAANYGLEQAHGKYVAYATSDDTWEPQKLELQVQYLEARPECGACFTFADIIDENSQKTDRNFDVISGAVVQKYYTQKEWIQRFIFDGNCLCHPSAVVRREVLDDIGGYNLAYCQAADLDMWLRIVRKYRIHLIETPLVNYRCYTNPQKQISGANDLKTARFLNEHMIIRRKFINSLSDEEMIAFFGDRFRNSDAASHEELEIEKAFLLMHCAHELPDFRIMGIEKFEELLENPKLAALLREKYHVSAKDIYQWNLGHFYLDTEVISRMLANDREILLLKEKFHKEQEFTGGLKKFRTELVNELGETKEKLQMTKEMLEKTLEKYAAAERKLGVAEKELRDLKTENQKTNALLEEMMLEKLQAQESQKRRKH